VVDKRFILRKGRENDISLSEKKTSGRGRKILLGESSRGSV